MNREEAIKIVKSHYPANKQMLNEALETLIPELKEDEDELTWLKNYISEEAYYLSMDIRDDVDRIKLKKLQKSLAWLEKHEKQGQTFTKKDVDDAYLKGVCDTKHELEKQGEKKPVEWSEEDEKMLSDIDNCIKNLPIFYETLNINGENKITEQFICDAINWLKSLKDRIQSEQSNKTQGVSKSHWKPTEEQYEALVYAYNSCSDTERGNYYEGVLETLIEDLHRLDEQHPKFRVGDTIKKKSTGDIVTISVVDLKNREYKLSNTGFIPFKYEYLWELIEKKSIEENNITGIKSKHAEGKLGEMIKKMETADKTEPKFKVGDWVISHYNHVAYVKSIDEKNYSLFCNDGNSEKLPIDYINRNWRLWTIEDAKDGDVLVASDDSIFIFAGVVHYTCKYYVALTLYNDVSINKEVELGSWEMSNAVHPATKEQRDLLFRRMKEAGYEWDTENKKLRAI